MSTSATDREPALWAVIPAAGVGRRMGGGEPKQYLRIAGRTVVEHAAGAVLASARVRLLVLAHHPDDARLGCLPLARDPRVALVAGGAERCDSVLAALAHLRPLACDDDWVLVHDAARPCLPHTAVNELLTLLADDPVGGILALPVTDTVKRADAAQRVAATLPREHIWRAQTPQVFRFALLWRALQAARERGQAVTDDCMAVEALGLQPRLVAGSPANIKITYPQDLPLAAWTLERGGGP